ncbi:putative lipoate-protein ligase a [Erysiphe necator]|uniref:Putative lipoate-protein ligase A n=1 Tax=Uncinula necator TaxID=52586 RepID=A0A0B1P290_UNCNE|nr:putative lipoate-protein ligase a [Erysiphe necator]
MVKMKSQFRKSFLMVSGSRFLPLSPHMHLRHGESRRYTTFLQAVSENRNKNQIYLSKSLDPFLNLSIEHFLFEMTPRDSVILFMYTNQPSIIIGRNQNPWNEINLNLVRKKAPNIRIVRRRSGGGTVFHDEGNVNYCVISPTSSFDRNKHAHMVVQALESVGIKRVKVNDRHDIVLEKTEKDGIERPYKISGSAYKLTRSRSLHHGTCLLSSPFLGQISQYLDSPARKFISARGVASVNSKITNVCISNLMFRNAVIRQFCQTYSNVNPIFVDDELKKEPKIFEGYAELKSDRWVYSQTPQFTFLIDGDSRFPTNPEISIKEAWKLSSSFHEEFTARNGCITSTSSSLSHFLNKNIHEIKDWRIKSGVETPELYFSVLDKIGSLLNDLFGKGGN